MLIKRSVFREYDIRGIAGVTFEPEMIAEYEKWYGKFPGVTITLEAAEAIGNAYGTTIKRQGGSKVLIGFEQRPYAEELKGAFIKGILATGVSVTDAGITPTPFIYFLSKYLGFDGGVNITGSHNVYFYNGFKMLGREGIPICSQDLQHLADMIENEDYDLSGTPGTLSELPNAYETYRDNLLSHIKPKRKLRIAIDCGNGTPGLYVKDLFERLGCEITKELYLEPDAHFPNHTPDPEDPRNMRELMAAVLETKADLGVAFDADGDRLGLVNEKGEMISPEDILLFMAHELAPRHQGKKVIFDAKCTMLLEKLLPEWGLVPYMHRTGHAVIKYSIRTEGNIILAGEESGHFFFIEDYVGVDDAMWGAAKMIELLSRSQLPASEQFAFIPKRVRTVEVKLPCSDDIKFKIVEDVVKTFSSQYEVRTIDGARVEFTPTSFGIVRASNTSPYITVRFEAETEEELLRMKNIFADILDPIPELADKLCRDKVMSPTGKLSFV